jgi:glycosyltransferase involved in cell wall biosynthesis
LISVDTSEILNTEPIKYMSVSSPRVSIIIRCYNEAEYIGKLLYGIFEQTMDDFEVILVDSGSTDGTLDIAQRYPINDVVYISPERFSFGRALNHGIEAASGRFCVFASAHVYPMRQDWLECLLQKFEDDIALVYGKQRGDSQTKFSEKQIFRKWFPDTDSHRQETPFCNNANCAIRRSVWEKHPYDEELPGLEDLDWAKRVRSEGWHISYASDATIIHVHDETPSEVYNRYRREALAHKQIMPEQDFSIWNFLQMFSYNTINDYRAAVSEDTLRNNLVEIPRFRLMQFWGTYRGFADDAPISERVWQRFYYPDSKGYPDRNNGSESGDNRVIDYDSYRHDAGESPVEE